MKKYKVYQYNYLETIRFGDNKHNPNIYTQVYNYVYIEDEIMLNVNKRICLKHNGKITEKENGEVVIEFNDRDYYCNKDIKLRYINNSKTTYIFVPISNYDELEVEKENEELRKMWAEKFS